MTAPMSLLYIFGRNINDSHYYSLEKRCGPVLNEPAINEGLVKNGGRDTQVHVFLLVVQFHQNHFILHTLYDTMTLL